MSSKSYRSEWRQYFVINNTSAKCKYCPKVLKTCSNTTNLKQHMERKHPAVIRTLQDSCQEMSQDHDDTNASRTLSLDDSVPSTSATIQPVTSTPKRARASIEKSFSKVIEYAAGGEKNKEITRAISEMICRDSLPFSVVEGEGFKKLMKTVAPLYKVPCRKTVTNLIDSKYEEMKAIVIGKLRLVKEICLTVDEWKDLQLKSYLGITVHYIQNYQMNSLNIACFPLHDNHTGEYLSEMIIKICEEWGLSNDKVVCATSDNGSNIVKAIELTYGRARHIRCIAHTLNLVVDNSVTTNDIKCFIDKVRRIVTWFHQSGVGAEELRKTQRGENVPEGKLKHLIGDVSTRWNSQLFMIERFIIMSGTIGSVLIKHPNAPQMLSGNEIVVLKEFEKLLKPFQKVTEEISGESYVTASKAIPIMKCLRSILDTIIPTTDLGINLKEVLVAELNKRFQNVQKVHLFSTATFLDPRFKKIHLDDAVALSRTITYLKRCLNTETEGNAASASVAVSSASSASSVAVVGEQEQDIWQAHHDKIMAASASRSVNTELDLYIAAPLSGLKTDPLAVWKSYEGAFPKMTELALKHLLVMASSAPAERLFSKAGNIVRKARNRILGKRLNKVLFLSSLPDKFWT